MFQELRKNFKTIMIGAKLAGLPTENLETLMLSVLNCLNNTKEEDERVVLLMEMHVLTNAALKSKLDDDHYRRFYTDVGFVLIGCIMALLKEFSHGDLS